MLYIYKPEETKPDIEVNVKDTINIQLYIDIMKNEKERANSRSRASNKQREEKSKNIGHFILNI